MEYLGTNSVRMTNPVIVYVHLLVKRSIDFNLLIQVEPGFDILPQIVIDDIQDVFGVDALETSHPISVTVNDPNEINELFDRISYGKGKKIQNTKTEKPICENPLSFKKGR